MVRPFNLMSIRSLSNSTEFSRWNLREYLLHALLLYGLRARADSNHLLAAR